MAKYISREAAIAYIRKQSEECQKVFEELGGEGGIYADAYNDLAEDFYSIPAADVAPVVHGRWEMRPTGMVTDTGPKYKAYCTVCNEPNKQYQPPFCPHCGAKMDGGVDHAST